MRRSSIARTLTGFTLALLALEAISQSKDDALASISDNSDEPSGWMRLEVAIFVDTTDETLASERWEIEPKLGYPTNRRWLTDYAEIKALMDEWGEAAVNIDTNGAIAVVPEPPPKPEPIPNPELDDSTPQGTETAADGTQAIPTDSATSLSESSTRSSAPSTTPSSAPSSALSSALSALADEKAQTRQTDSDVVNAALSQWTENSAGGIDTPQLEESALGPTQETPITQAGVANASAGTLGVVASDFSTDLSTDQPRLTLAEEESRDNEQAPLAITKIPLERLQASGRNADTGPNTDKSSGPIAIDALASDIANLQAVSGEVLMGEQFDGESASDGALAAKSTEPLEDSELLVTADQNGSQDPTQPPIERQDQADNFFAIEGLGEDFNALAGGDETPSRLADDSLSAETIDWLSDFETEEASETAILDAEPTPPPLPASYQAMPLEMLPPGLKKLERETGRRPVSVLSWLQPKDGTSDAVIVDSWSDEGVVPNLQGTVRISRAADDTPNFQLTTNIWANTTANYLPQRLPAIEIPTAPARVLLIEPEQAASEEIDDAEVEYIDISTGLNTLTSASTGAQDVSDSESETPTPALPKHAIGLNETRDLREGYVRYIDHPVIQVAAVWRELTYSELYELGEAQRVRKDIDSLTRTLVTKQSTRATLAAEQEPPQLNQ